MSLHRLRKLFQNGRDDWNFSVGRARISTLAGAAFVVFLACVGFWAMTTIPGWQVNEVLSIVLKNDDVKRFELENEARKTLSQIVLGAFGLIALFFTWGRVRAGDRNVRVIEQGHITDRYTKAIEQLGKLDGEKQNIEVRLCGIYALERIAFDSARDHWTIMEVLTAYVRQNAPAPVHLSEATERHQFELADEGPRTDIQAILTVLGRRRRGNKREKGKHVSLRKCCLTGADLREAHLERAHLMNTHLERSILVGAHLEEASLYGAHLEFGTRGTGISERRDPFDDAP